MKRLVISACLLVLWIGGPVSAQLNWYKAASTSAPPAARYHHGMAWDGYNLLLHGGGNTKVGLSDTWHWTGKSWFNLAPKPTVGSRYLHAMVGIPYRGEVLLFGGNTGNPYYPLDETWCWKGWNKTWSKVNTLSPPARNEHSMVYDSNEKEVVLFGGYNRGTWYGDTWVYEPDSFLQRWISLRPCSWSMKWPTARYGTAMAFDPVAGRVVLFGGWEKGGTAKNDTWLGHRCDPKYYHWVQVYPKTVPPARLRHQMVYDSTRRRVVMMAGCTQNSTFLNDTWEWDGSDWKKLNLATSPSGRQALRAAYDPVRKRITMFGGYANGKALSDTWELYTANPASTWTCGTGCKGSHGKIAALSALKQPIIGQTFELTLTHALSGAHTPLAIGFHRADLDLGPAGAPGCTLYPLPAMLLSYQANAAGSWAAPAAFALPASASLLGLEVHFQAGVFDPKANSLGLVTSNALTARIGY